MMWRWHDVKKLDWGQKERPNTALNIPEKVNWGVSHTPWVGDFANVSGDRQFDPRYW